MSVAAGDGSRTLAYSGNGTSWTEVTGTGEFNGYSWAVASNNAPNLYPAIGAPSATLQAWQNSAGGTLSVIDGAGNMGLGATSTNGGRLVIQGSTSVTPLML